MHINDDDTIVAIGSPRGPAARGIVRLSGVRAVEVASACLEEPLGGGTYFLVEGRFKLPHTAAFPVLIYVMRAPRSYTREDVVEIHAPGSPPLLSAITSELCRRGARPAEPGEFTKRAFLSGRIDLAQAEAVCQIITARSESEERLALSVLGGDLSEEVRRIRARLLDLAVDMEAGLDFHDDDVTFAGPEKVKGEISAALDSLRRLADESVTRRVHREEVLTVLFGAANAGKSSIFNMLAGSDQAIIHETPGTTRDFLEAVLEMGGVSFLMVDTAGVRPPAEVVEEIAVERSRRFVAEAQLVLFVVDASVGVTPDVEALYAQARRMPHIVVLNKADRALAVDRQGWIRRFGGTEVVEVSAMTALGKDALHDALVDHVLGGKVDLSDARFLLANRQRALLEKAADTLESALLAVGNAGEEIVAFETREAIESLGRVTGEDYVEDLIDEVFSRFCLGK